MGGICHRAPPLDKQLSKLRNAESGRNDLQRRASRFLFNPQWSSLKIHTSNAKQAENDKEKEGMGSRETGPRNIGGVGGRRGKRENCVIIFQFFKKFKKNIHKDSLMHFYRGLEKQRMTKVIKYTDE